MNFCLSLYSFWSGLLLPLTMVIINFVLGPRVYGEKRLATYESGVPPYQNGLDAVRGLLLSFRPDLSGL